MESFDFEPYRAAVLERINANGLSAYCISAGRLRQLCLLTTEELLRENLKIEVNELDAIVDRYQKRYNMIGSVGKAFYQETACGKHYKYLSIECAILYFENREFRFMD